MSRSVTITLRIFIGLVFLTSGILKVIHHQQYLQLVNSYKMLHEILINLFVIISPYTEIVCGTFLVFGFLTNGALFVVSLSLTAYFIANVFFLIRNLEPVIFQNVMELKILIILAIIFNLILIFLTALLMFYSNSVFSIDDFISKKYKMKKDRK